MANNVYRLSVRRGPEEGQTFPLTSTSVTVGRDPMADIVLADPEVSRQHARFTRTEEGYQIQDLGSTNGTFVDGKRLGGEVVPLQTGAVITMGSNVTLVLEGTPDPMATVVSAGGELDFDEPDEPEDDALRTMIESGEQGADELPDYESSAADFDDDVMASESEATAMEFPSAADTGPLGALPEEPEEDDFSFDFDEADYGEPVAPSSGVDPDDRTVLDMEASDFSSFSAESEDDELPSFDQPSYREESELPSFGAEEPAQVQKPPAESPGRIPPPPPPPPDKSEPGANRNRNIIIAVVALILLCCCCSLLMYYVLGDPLLELLQNYLQI